MSRLADGLSLHAFPAILLAVTLLLLGLLAALRRRLGRWFFPLALLDGAVALTALGGLLLSPLIAGWLLLAAGLLVLVLLLVLLTTGGWSPAAAWLAAALLLVGLGGLYLTAFGRVVADLGRDAVSIQLLQPWWLLLLLLEPMIVVLAWPRLNRSELRPWLAVALRCGVVALLALALADPRLKQPNDHVTVLFVVDRSLSIPEEPFDNPVKGIREDRRSTRIRDFINNAVEKRGKGHDRDRAGLIIFGRQPRLELAPSDAPRFSLPDLPGALDGNYTDIGAALKLALASFEEGTGKRIVLISDGNENLGNAEEQARLARSLGVQIDVVPLAAGHTNEEEILVERVDAPALVEQGGRLPIRVLVRSHNPNIVLGTLTLQQITEGEVRPVGEIPNARLRLGLNAFSFTRPVGSEQRSYTYEAEFVPRAVLNDKEEVLHKGALAGDRPQNNRAAAHVVARGRRRVLLLSDKNKDTGRLDHRRLAETLAAVGKGKLQVVPAEIGVLDNYKDREKLAVFLSSFDCVILANISADQISEEQQEVLRSNTHDQGCGLVMIGGPDSYGAGGWQNTAVEKALPVDSQIQSLQVLGKGGLVLIMHASEMADGNLWQKRIAKLAVERLSPADEVGVLYYSFNVKWHIPLQQIGSNRNSILAQIDKMTPGDMPNFDPALQMAHTALIDPRKGLSTKHVIIISDGDPNYTPGLLKPMRDDKITVTTVGVATHGPAQDQVMAAIARGTGGRTYSVKDPRQLPAIYIKESRLVSQAFVHEKRFQPQVLFRSGPTDKLPDPVPPLGGFVRTTPKSSPLVELPMITPRLADQEFPLLAYWHYGLGKAVAFTSDAGDPKLWSREWIEGGGPQGGMFAKFWEQIIEWSLRPVESRRLAMSTEYRDGKIRIVVEARTEDNKPDTTLQLRGGITGPGKGKEGASAQRLRFVQTNSGVYEVEVKAEEAGSWFIAAQAVRLRKVVRDGKEHVIEEGVDSVRSGVTLPYSPEFRDLESNAPLLERLRELTDGQTFAENDESLNEAARSGVVFRRAPERVRSLLPLWHWLLFWACVLLLADVAVRRLALEPERWLVLARNAWARLRGRPVEEASRTEFIERLRSRKAQVDQGLSRPQAARRFEGAASTGSLAPEGADVTPSSPAQPPRPTTAPGVPPPVAPQPEPEAGDFAARLLRAKKKVWEERDKEDKGGS